MQDTINQINFLKQFVSENRIKRFDEVINQRTNYIQIVLENLYQAHNASAVLRSCESFGLQTVHFIENKNSLKISADVAMGSSNWLTINRYKDAENNTINALTKLKQQGFKIVATTPHTNSYTIDALPIDQKIALVFGTEIDGISKDVYDLADEFVKIPMYGFTESFNISVCAALCMYELTTRVRKNIPNYLLTNEEKQEVYLNWLKTSVDKSSQLLNQHFKTV
ncbi:MAG: RNA methyltransferase [Bacteroidetes bacterium]|nr:RNA methyltransferase [Bacteroidota bacterium]